MKIEDQVALLMQGTEYGDEEVKQAMTRELNERLILAEKEHRPLRVYCGYDPRKADLHLGHTITMRKLRQFQDLGHEVTFLIGTYTSLIGDPSDKNILRPLLTAKEVEENARTYADQAYRILDPKKTTIRYNAEWLAKLTFADLIHLASNFTLQQFLTRENFKLRFERGDAIYLHETFYSIMQGYDAFALKTDVQVGGTDQLFNILTAARKLMTFLGEKPNIGIIMGILPGTDGIVRMSKSLGNHIPIDTTPEDMYGKVMSLPDSALPVYFRLVTSWSPSKIEKMEKELESGSLHPRDAKMSLAWEITSSLYEERGAEKAQNNFISVIMNHEIPEEMKTYVMTGPDETIKGILLSSDLVTSGSEVIRLVKQGGIKFDGKIVENPYTVPKQTGILQVGPRRFLKVKKPDNFKK